MTASLPVAASTPPVYSFANSTPVTGDPMAGWSGVLYLIAFMGGGITVTIAQLPVKRDE
ncbi:MAG: hypothetical protein FWE87_05750 [Coriobacteriia bacterium]|nr:hypothetical protein [Coriobacteriia bacterium]